MYGKIWLLVQKLVSREAVEGLKWKRQGGFTLILLELFKCESVDGRALLRDMQERHAHILHFLRMNLNRSF